MKPVSLRKGSALLIVLGMLSFLIISAVGFATYMRSARLPSSYLRRTNSSRMLVKGAVARAISFVDRAVNDNPHPNIGSKFVSEDRDYMQDDANRTLNFWKGRVLLATNRNFRAEDPDPARLGYHTVPTLCMEALAYIPPPLINEARHYSRITPTARWQTFDFDVGRYAFTAVDVSDYFDINRLAANVSRSSSPQGRVSLAYLFENAKPNQEHSTVEDGAKEWDQFMEEFRRFDKTTGTISFDSRYPLVSLADYNLALGHYGKIGKFWSPFYDYVKNSGSGNGNGTGTEGKGILPGSGESFEDLEVLRRMTFVTDGYFPNELTKSEMEEYDLNNPDNQPFDYADLDDYGSSASLITPMQNALAEWRRYIGRLGCAILFDYLDTDHRPISLGIPTTERVPMVAGINLALRDGALAVTREPKAINDEAIQVSGETKASRQATLTVTYSLDGAQLAKCFMNGQLSAITTFPFAHGDDADSSAFTMDGRFAFFFSDAEMPLRTNNRDGDKLHLADKSIPATGVKDGLISIKLKETAISDVKTMKLSSIDSLKEEDAVGKTTLALGEGVSIKSDVDNMKLLKVTYTWTQTKQTTGGVVVSNEWKPTAKEVMENPNLCSDVKAESDLKVYDAKGGVKTLDVSTAGRSYDDGPNLYLNTAVWLRVKDGSDVVDMVPACVLDDKIQNNDNGADKAHQGLQGILGDAYPLMRFDTTLDNAADPLKISVKRLDELVENSKQLAIGVSPKAAFVPDPRFNHAPESWIRLDQELDAQTWLTHAKRIQGQNGSDTDIFMQTSDAGYLQSKFELALLPRVFTFNKGNNPDGYLGDLESPNSYRGRSIPDEGSAVNRKYAWRSYEPFSDEGAEAFEDVPWTNDGPGFRVNPYSDSTNVIMAAFANTPIDWKRASTNKVEKLKGGSRYSDLDVKKFNEQYAFNEFNLSSDYVLTSLYWKDLEALAGRFMRLVRSDRDGDWEAAWDELGWQDGGNRFGDVTLDRSDTLWTSDRKFLYGYWRDCFAAKQQLFLVFARAEPVMLGGGGEGQLPPQLGAKAMALVWRDPKRQKNDSSGIFPHCTRILFYRQFD